MAKKEVHLKRSERHYAKKAKTQKERPPKSTPVAAPLPPPTPAVEVPAPAPQSTVPARVNIDLSRYYRFQAGESEFDIAAKDEIDVKVAMNSIQRGQQFEGERQKSILTRLRFDAAVTNENLRNKVRNRLEGTFVDALEKLLIGEKCVVERAKDGKVTIHKYTDPDILSKGIEQYRKTTTMEEKATNMQPLVFNLNQQNNLTPTDDQDEPKNRPNERYNFEDRIAKIRRAQRESGEVVSESVEGTLVDDEPEEIEVQEAATEESPWHF